MLERDLQTYLFDNPNVLFPGQKIDEKHWEFPIDGRRIDLLFHVNGLRYIVEIKRQTIRREDVGQVMEYYGRMRRLGIQNNLRMILVAPSIPSYWSVTLEEFGIQCIEVAHSPVIASQRIAIEKAALSQQRKNTDDADLLKQLETVTTISFEEMLPPVSRQSLALSHFLLKNSLEVVNESFSDYQVLPVRMRNPNHQDVLCFGFRT